ncbi:hypothetical protein EMCRGX_G005155 [Ephydatia muelleri]
MEEADEADVELEEEADVEKEVDVEEEADVEKEVDIENKVDVEEEANVEDEGTFITSTTIFNWTSHPTDIKFARANCTRSLLYSNGGAYTKVVIEVLRKEEGIP